MKYIAALDYNHLDNGVFLTAVARALARQQEAQAARAIVVHGESEYTERLIQTGIMREEATVRAIKDLNHRLIALFADQGVSAVGLNGYQRESITLKDGDLNIDMNYFEDLHQGPVLLLSNLVLDRQSGQPTPIPLPRYIDFLHGQFSPDEVFLFSKFDHTSPKERPENPGADQQIPDDLKGLSIPVQITTTEAFNDLTGNNS